MKNLKLIFTMMLISLSTSMWAARTTLPCEGFTVRPNNSKVLYGGVFTWTASSSNTMQLFKFEPGTLSDYTSMKITLSNFVDKTTDQSVGTGNKVRLLFLAGTSTVKTQHFATIDGREKTLDLTTLVTAEELATITEIAIGGDCAAGSVHVDAESIRLVKNDNSELVCAEITKRSGNNNCSYDPYRLMWTASNSNTMQIFSFTAGTLSKYENLKITLSDFVDNTSDQSVGSANKVRLLFIDGSSTVKTQSFATIPAAGSEKTLKLTDMLTASQIASITEIAIGGACNSSSVHIEAASIYLETPEQEIATFTAPIANFEWYNYTTNEVYGHTQKELSKQLNTELDQNKIIYGPYSGDATTAYMNVADYDKVVFTLSKRGTWGIRLMYGNATNGDEKTIKIGTNSTYYTYTQSLADMPKIGTIKTYNESNRTSITVSDIDFIKEFNPATTAWTMTNEMQANVDYDRFFVNGRYSTICLPFDLTTAEVAAAGSFYELVAFDGTNLGFNPVTTTEAYKPYLFIPKTNYPFNNLGNKTIKALPAETQTALAAATFKGIMQPINDVKNAESGTVYGYDASNGNFVKVVAGSGAVSINAFRAYIVLPASAQALPARLNVAIRQMPTSVSDIQSATSDTKKIIRDGQIIIIRNGEEYNIQGQKL